MKNGSHFHRLWASPSILVQMVSTHACRRQALHSCTLPGERSGRQCQLTLERGRQCIHVCSQVSVVADGVNSCLQEAGIAFMYAPR
jgi:hypothetical protein